MLLQNKKSGFNLGVLSAVVLSGSILASCGGDQTPVVDTPGDGGGTPDTTALTFENKVKLVGAGASFPAPLYQRWFQEFSKAQDQIQVDYQSVGSGAGVEQFTKQTVDFGASDVAMKDEEIDSVDRGVLLLPMTAGSIVLAYNLDGVENLNLTREAYLGILLGKITKWNDPAIAEANPDADLPDSAIAFVHRSDGSGTTGVFTKHLSAISPEWEEKVGAGKTVEWPAGTGAKGNEGVTAQIAQTPGSIGYIEYGYAKLNDIAFASLENKAGEIITPSDEAASVALGAVDLPENLRAFIPDPEGADSYPIVTYTWMLAYQQYDDADKAKALEAAIEFGLNEGQDVATELGYVPLPKNVREKVAEAANGISADYDIQVR